MQLAKVSSKFTMRSMSSDYDQLLDATLQHLESLKARGVRHVAVSPESLLSLAQPAPRPVVLPQTTPTPSETPKMAKIPIPAPANRPANRNARAPLPARGNGCTVTNRCPL